jgi:hypothetical protein
MTSRRALLAALPGTACAQSPAGPLATPFDLPPRSGPLRPLGGLELNRAAIGFGGFSGLHLDVALNLTVISDTGRWFRAPLLMTGERPTGLGTPTTGMLRDGSGEALRRGRTTDAEALARRPDGTWLVGFERWHRIRAFTALDAPGSFFEAPPGVEAAPPNGGLEALAVLADGRLLAIAEFQNDPTDPALRRAWLGGPGDWRPTSYRPAPGFTATDAAGLTDGGALVLERRFALIEGGFTARLVHLPSAALETTPLTGQALLNFPPDGPAENYEGVAVLRRGSALWIALISDDNQNAFQRSLLLLYAWTA